MACLDDDQLVVVNYPAGKDVKHGPGCFSFCCASLDVQRKITLKDTEYVVVTHMDVGDDPENPRDIIEVISGPCLYELDDPYATVSQVQQKPNLTRIQYLKVTNKKSGEKKVVSGPLVYVPGPYDEFERIKNVVVLNNDEYIYVTHEDTGTIEIVEGPTKFIPGVFGSLNLSCYYGNVIMSDCECEYVKCELHGNGFINHLNSKKISINITGGGTIYVDDLETVVTKNVHGLGKIMNT